MGLGWTLRCMGYFSYSDYLKSDHWKDVRRRYWKSRMPKVCLGCEAIDNLELHHRTYRRIGREKLMDLVPVCRTCHQLIHDKFERNGRKNLWRTTKKALRGRKPPKNKTCHPQHHRHTLYR